MYTLYTIDVLTSDTTEDSEREERGGEGLFLESKTSLFNSYDANSKTNPVI